MSKVQFQYDRMMDDAVRGVVARVLREAATLGLPGQHHLLITFRTGHPGVDIAPDLRERYPHDMTIILQHQFWDLGVDDTGFTVTLSFNKVPQRLVVPYAAITGFADPSVRWGIKLQPRDEDAAPTAAAPTAATSGNGSVPAAGEAIARAPGRETRQATVVRDETPVGDADAKVVTLDTFRRK